MVLEVYGVFDNTLMKRAEYEQSRMRSCVDGVKFPMEYTRSAVEIRSCKTAGPNSKRLNHVYRYTFTDI